MSIRHERKRVPAANTYTYRPDDFVMVNDLADFQAEAIARGYTRDFAVEARSAAPDIANELRVVEYTTFDGGTDPGDDASMYLIESTSGLKGYLILSDSFHADPRKAAFIDVLVAKRRVNG
jgi:hypothetical protein